MNRDRLEQLEAHLDEGGTVQPEILRELIEEVRRLNGVCAEQRDSLRAAIASRDTAVNAWVERCTKAETLVDRLTQALTPSSITKAALLGEFQFSAERFDGQGESYAVTVTVPWTTTKEIMAAIRKLAGLKEAT